MSDLEPHSFESEDRIPLLLQRWRNEECPPVLFLHGASASHSTFLIPGPDLQGRPRCLAGWLHRKGYEPWLLDWRGSGKVVDEARGNGTLERRWSAFDFDQAARCDVQGALKKIRKVRPDADYIGAIGHCMGAGTLAQAIACGALPRDCGLTHVVLLTLGLFYEPPFDSRLKSQDHVLERLLLRSPPEVAVDPQSPLEEWPRELAELYQNWPPALRPHREQKPSRVRELCDRLSFMYGAPYLEANLVPEIHSDIWTVSFHSGVREPQVGDTVRSRSGSVGVLLELALGSGSWKGGDAVGVLRLESDGEFESGETLWFGGRVFATSRRPIERVCEAELPKQFGPIPLKMYAHGAQNVRRRWAATFNADNNDVGLVGTTRTRFDELERLTLVTGAKNQLWHRDSVQRMHEWLIRGTRRRAGTPEKWVLPDYGHQDLLWGKRAREDVFPKIRRGLPPT